VAESLEAEWNEKLRALGAAQRENEGHRAAAELTVNAEQRQGILAFAADFPAIWRDPRTPARECKRMLGLLIDDVTLITQRQLTVAVRFRGGATTTLSLPRPLTAQQLRATHDDVRRQIDTFLDDYTDAQVAHVLNEHALRTGAGDAFDGDSVKWVRFAHKLKSLKQRLLESGWLTTPAGVSRLGVTRSTLGRWRQVGRSGRASATTMESGCTGLRRRRILAPRAARRRAWTAAAERRPAAPPVDETRRRVPRAR
jgi:hypothetical protein